MTKWQILHDLAAARKSYGLSDRALTVLSALLSFHPDDSLAEPAVVFPSNRKLAERANGMAESTLRRHLSALVDAGLIYRRDSPNRKRYARRTEMGLVPFGFDLSPLHRQRFAIAAEAERIARHAARRKTLREAVMVTLQDVAAMVQERQMTGPMQAIDEIRQLLRRKLEIDALIRLLARLQAMLSDVTPSPAPASVSAEVSGNDSQNERHIQDSNKILIESEPEANPAAAADQPSLPFVTAICSELTQYDPHPVRGWEDFIEKAARMAPMMGISVETWRFACVTMTPLHASITVAAMLQRFSSIRNPGGYLRALCRKAASDGFSPMPMIHALARAGAAS